MAVLCTRVHSLEEVGAMSVAHVPVHGVHDPRRDVAWGWLSLLLFPVSLVLAFVVGELLASRLFGWSGAERANWWQALIVLAPTVILFALPILPAWHFGMRAHRNGAHTGRIAAWIAVAIAAVFVLQNGIGWLLG